jgi:F0F1-type ATP synthase membrane subunit b/b'
MESVTATQSSGEQAREKAQQVAGQAQDKAQQAAGQAKGKIREQVDQRSTQAGDQITSVAGDVRSVSDELRKQGKEAGPACGHGG